MLKALMGMNDVTRGLTTQGKSRFDRILHKTSTQVKPFRITPSPPPLPSPQATRPST